MLEAVLNGLGFVAKLFGMVTLAEQLFQSAQERREGKISQQADDLKAANKISDQMAEAAANAPVDDKEVDDILRQGKL